MGPPIQDLKTRNNYISWSLGLLATVSERKVNTEEVLEKENV
jgi:hypothetical protein